MADRQGKALFTGTPKGLNHFYDLYQTAKVHVEWETFQFTTEQGGNVTESELASAASQLDERTYRQEFQARFENLGAGLVYYAFDREQNVTPVDYDPTEPLFWAIDFNVNPMCSVIGQQIGERVHVLEELVLPQSNTWRLCEEFIQRIQARYGQRGRRLEVTIYGDATGENRHSSSDRSDWQIVRQVLGRRGDVCDIDLRVPRQNPSVKHRVNAVNAMLCNQQQRRRLLIHPDCKQLIKDFERVSWATDANGNILAEIDKSDPERTHVSDALGYRLVADSELTPRGRAVRQSFGF